MSNLPANIDDLANALDATLDFVREAVDDVVTYIKMDKTGEWTYGTEETPIEEDSDWAVNPMSFETGFSAFDNDGNRVGEEMRNMTEAPITQADLPNVGAAWGKQIGFSVKCLNGEDEGFTGVIFQRSRGGLTAAMQLLKEQIVRQRAGKEDYVPIIRLEQSHYKHSKYGKIFTPVFKIVDWMDMNGVSLDEKDAQAIEKEPEPEPEKEEKAPVRRRRRRSA